MSGGPHHNPRIRLWPSDKLLRAYPTIEEWKEASRPYGWPFIRTSEFMLPPKPPFGSLQHHEWSDQEFGSILDFRPAVSSAPNGQIHDRPLKSTARDYEDSDEMLDGSYKNSDRASTDLSNSSDDEEDDGYMMQDAEDLISDSEIADLKAERLHTPWPNITEYPDDETAKQQALNRALSQLPLLEQAEAAAVAAWDTTTFVKLLEQWYELLAEMGHWDYKDIAYAPHNDHPINVELGRALGFDETVLDLMTRMPYISIEADQTFGSYRTVSDDTRLADYRQEGDLRDARKPLVPLGVEHPNLDPWIIPLVIPNWHGFVIYLDTRLGAVRTYSTSNGPPEYSPEWVKEQKESSESTGEAQHIYRRAPLVPALDYMRTIIEAYRTLEALPLIKPNNSLLQRFYRRDEVFVRKPGGEQSYYEFNDEANLQKRALLDLYKHYGWATNWQRNDFLMEWRDVKEQVANVVSCKADSFQQLQIQMLQEQSEVQEEEQTVQADPHGVSNDVDESVSLNKKVCEARESEVAVASSLVEKWQMIDLTATEVNAA